MKSAIFAVCVLVFLAGAAQSCTLAEMTPCLSAVTDGTQPTYACCTKVETVDVACFCKLVEQGNYSADIKQKAMAVPAKCGEVAYKHFKGQLCAGERVP